MTRYRPIVAARAVGASCPSVYEHKPCPVDGYAAWFDWAEWKAKTHQQVKCPGCGLYVIWRARGEAS